MIEICIPKDISQYESKLIGPFTGRQVGCFVCAVALGVPAFSALTKIGFAQDLAILVMVLIATPFLLLGWVKPYGMKFERFVQTAFISNVLSPQKRKYISMNAFEVLNKEDFSYSDVVKTMSYNKKERAKEASRKLKTNIDYMC